MLGNLSEHTYMRNLEGSMIIRGNYCWSRVLRGRWLCRIITLPVAAILKEVTIEESCILSIFFLCS